MCSVKTVQMDYIIDYIICVFIDFFFPSDFHIIQYSFLVSLLPCVISVKQWVLCYLIPVYLCTCVYYEFIGALILWYESRKFNTYNLLFK